MTRRTARHLAKAIIHLGLAEWNETNTKNIGRLLNHRRQLNTLFNKSGYEFGAGDGSRIRKRRDA